ncbi:hypothetical protein [Burkholderia aenigmatica]|uniref:hypothetical protein n=1 Tax=Burkholderia aenigmatica TaxID=2015348 RepID=UPI001583EB12|nr:hypothetical protein [Burkholderia aenigmatica]
MLSTITFNYDQLTQRAEAEIRAWMARANQDGLRKRERVQGRERAIGALQLWLALTHPHVLGSSLAVRVTHAADAARMCERVGLPEQAARWRIAPFAGRGSGAVATSEREADEAPIPWRILDRPGGR